MTACAIQLFRGNAVPVERILDIGRYRQLPVRLALIIDIIAAGIPLQLIAALFLISLIALDILYVIKVRDVVQLIRLIFILQPAADNSLLNLALGIRYHIDGLVLARVFL